MKLLAALLAALAILAVGTGCSQYPQPYPGQVDASASQSQFGGPPSEWVQNGIEKGREFWRLRPPTTFPQISCYNYPTVYRQDLDEIATTVAGVAQGCASPDPNGNTTLTGPPQIILDNDRTWTRNATCVIVVHEMGHLRGWGHTDGAPPTAFGGPLPTAKVMDPAPHIGDANC